MYGVYGYFGDEDEIMCLFTTHLWEDAFKVWDASDNAICIIDMETGEVLWD